MTNIERFTEYMRDQNKSDNTIRNYVADLRKYTEYLGGTPGGHRADFAHMVKIETTHNFEKSGLANDESVTDTNAKEIELHATTKEIDAYVSGMMDEGFSVSTINRRIQSIRTYYTFLESEGIIEINPAENLKSKRIAKQNETQWLENHQVRAIFEVLDTIKADSRRNLQRAIFSVLVNTGLRAQELCDIKLRDIDWESGLISVYGKGGKFRKVPFNNAPQKAVKCWLQYRRESGDYLFQTERSDKMTTRALEHMTKKVSEQLTFKFTVHQLRHTALKQIANTTGRIEIVASVAGHSNVNTSKRYIEPSLKEIGEAMKRTEFDY